MKSIILAAAALLLPVAASAQFTIEMKDGRSVRATSPLHFSQSSDATSWSLTDIYDSALDLSLVEAVSIAPAGQPAVGDFYFSDGTWSASLQEGKTPIAVVYWVGDPGADDEALRTDHPGCVHGLAVGLRQRADEWQEYYEDTDETVSEWIVDNTDYPAIRGGYGVNAPYNKMRGYSNTRAIEAYNDEFVWDYEVLCVSGIDFLMNGMDAPATSSGWFLPSAKELSLIISGAWDGDIDDIGYEDNPPVAQLAMVNSRLALINGATQMSGVYWSSNESSRTQAFTIKTANALLMETSKGGSNYVRPILAF